MRCLVPLAGLFLVAAASAQTDAAANALRAEAHGVSLAVTPLTRSQKTAFFMARGFKEKEIEAYARACGFSFTFENRERAAVALLLATWTAETERELVRFTPLSGWDADWDRLGIAQPARIAFRWAQFPAEHEFARGDWIMGMANLERPPQGKFRIVARFVEGGKTLELPVDGVACAPPD